MRRAVALAMVVALGSTVVGTVVGVVRPAYADFPAPPPPQKPISPSGPSPAPQQESRSGRSNTGVGKAVVLCGMMAAGSTMIHAAQVVRGEHRQLTPREAAVAAARGCFVFWLIVPLFPPDNACTRAVARDAWQRYERSALYRERVWMERGWPDQAEFGKRYHDAYTKPCVVKKKHKRVLIRHLTS